MKTLIDGYNVIGVHPEIDFKDPNKEDLLISDLFERSKALKLRMSIIFDGKGDLNSHESRYSVKNMEIIYTSNTQSADAYIIDKIPTLSPKSSQIISSDREIRSKAKTYKIPSISSSDFLNYLGKRGQNKKMAPEKPSNHSEIDFWMTTFEQKGE